MLAFPVNRAHFLRPLQNGLTIISEMNLLNHHVKTIRNCAERYFIYNLKEYLIDALCRGGFVLGIETSIQKVTCTNEIHNLNIGLDETCSDCGGTKIYAINKTYAYEFMYRGHHFVWHQPQENTLNVPTKFGKIREHYSKYVDIPPMSVHDMMADVWKYLVTVEHYRIPLIGHGFKKPTWKHKYAPVSWQ